MNVSLCNNSELIIQARNLRDYENALRVAESICGGSGGVFTIASVCEFERWVHVIGAWDNFQKSELMDLYSETKKDLIKK